MTKVNAKTNAKVNPGKKPHLSKAIDKGSIVIQDDGENLTFTSEEELFHHFKDDVEIFESGYLARRKKEDYSDNEAEGLFHCLDVVLDDPDEVWEDNKTLENKSVFHYVRMFEQDGETFYYVAVAHVAKETPTFIYLHFPTRDPKLMDAYRHGQLVFDRVLKEVENGAIDGDSLSEGDELALGLYRAMLKLRADNDIPESQFLEFSDLRETTIEEPDEIWRSSDVSDQTLVHFIREFDDVEGEENMYYIVVTVEEGTSNSHALLCSFPTRDQNLVERYRHGENLQAEEVVQEASH